MLYPQEIIDQVIESSNIVDIISEYVKLTKKGSTYFGLCPFHNEKTPSFSVTDNGTKKLFYCFGCHAGGSVLTFLMKYENYSYSEAMKILADRAGITLPKPDYSKQDSARYRLKEKVLEVYREAAVYYFHLLKSDRGAAAYRYLKGRGLTDATILGYGLGYSDKYRDDLYRYMKAKGYSDEVLNATGLFSIREKGVHDYFWNRVMFPIMDQRNKVIAFGGRVMGDGEPKYLNSPESIVFEKRKTLFGLNVAKKHKGQELILCEGYMDVISLHQAGFTQAVASLGTALTREHAMVLSRFTSKVALSYDSDSAGRNAAVRAIPILRSVGLSVKVIDLKPCKDPDELIKTFGADEFRERIKNARNGVLFELDVLKEAFDMNDPDSKTNFYNEAARRLSAIDDDIERENYLRAASEQYQIDYNLLKSRTVRYALNKGPAPSVPPALTVRTERNIKNAGIIRSQETLLKYLAADPSLFGKIRDVLDESDFTGDPYDRIALLLFAQLRKGKINISGIAASFEDEEDQEKAALILSPPEDEDIEELRKLLNDCVINIKRNSLEEKIKTETDILKVLELRKEQEKLQKAVIIG